MPNIEIHGIHGLEIGKEIRKDIFRLFGEEPFIDDLVVTIFPTDVCDRCGKAKPFLRLVSNPEPYLKKMIRLLPRIGFDLEILKLQKFIEGGKRDESF